MRAARPSPNRRRRSLDTPPWVGDVLSRHGIVLILIGLVIVMTILTPIIRGEQFFLTSRNLLQVGLQASINAIIAVGMTFVITSGGIDLSVGSVVALGGVVAARAMVAASGSGSDLLTALVPLIGFVTALMIGLACGVFNGLLITRANLSPFIVTLGTMGIFRGLALVVSEGRPVYGFPRTFQAVFAGQIGPVPGIGMIPSQVIVALIVALLFWFVLTRTKFGKYTVAIGGSEDATRLAGIPVGRYKLGIYGLCGLLSGIGATLLLARLSSGDPTFGSLFELDAIAATVMGGTRLSGGEGSISGTIVGALIISMVRNAMNLFNVPSYWQELIIGTVIVLAVMLDQWRRRQSTRD